MCKLDLEKAEKNQRSNCPSIRWIIEKAREFQKNILEKKSKRIPEILLLCWVEGFGSLERLRKGGKNTQKNYTKKDLHDPDNHDGVSTHLEPDILEVRSQVGLGKHHYDQS